MGQHARMVHDDRRSHGRGGSESARRPALGPPAVLALSRTAGNRVVGALVQREQQAAGTQVRSVLRSTGTPLDAGFRARAESFLGASLSHVRVHRGAAAASSAAAIRAQAYTSGADVVFGAGKYDTASGAGRHRLAHELVHVVQQQRGPVPGTPTAGGLQVSDPSDRFEREADRLAADLLAGHPGPGASLEADAALIGPASGLAVQRRIGFEIETGIPLTKRTTNVGYPDVFEDIDPATDSIAVTDGHVSPNHIPGNPPHAATATEQFAEWPIVEMVTDPINDAMTIPAFTAVAKGWIKTLKKIKKKARSSPPAHTARGQLLPRLAERPAL